MSEMTGNITYLSDVTEIQEVAASLRIAAVRCHQVIKRSSELDTIKELEVLGIALMNNAKVLEDCLQIGPASNS